MKKELIKILNKNEFTRQFVKSKRNRAILGAAVGFIINLAYSAYNIVLGFMSYSWWFVSVGAYYTVLSVMRFSAVRGARKIKREDGSELFILRFSGCMLLLLSFVLAGTAYLAVISDKGIKYHEIVMITIATYTFTKTTLAVTKVIKAGKSNSPIIIAIRNISCADALVSIFSLQRSMLVSFDGMSAENIRLFNTLTGAGVCLAVVFLAVNMIRYKVRKEEIK